MKLQAGFTLIEALSTGIISTIVAGALLSVLHMSNNQIKEGSGNLRMMRLQTVVSDQIRMSTRTAQGVKSTGDDPGLKFDPLLLDPLPGGFVPPDKEIRLCDLNGLAYARYRIPSGMDVTYLEEWKDGPAGFDYYAFTVGGDTVFIDPDSSFFRILPGRIGIDFTLKYARVEDGKSYTFPRIRETALCRNR